MMEIVCWMWESVNIKKNGELISMNIFVINEKLCTLNYTH